MAWRQGFLRVWVVLTVVWLIAAGSFLWSPIFGGKILFEDYYRFSWSEPYAIQVTPLDGDKFTEMVSNRPAVDMAITTLTSRDFAFHLYHAARARPEDLAPAIAAVQTQLDRFQTGQDETRAAAIPGYLAGLILPPIVVLLLGAVVGWVASGFRRSA